MRLLCSVFKKLARDVTDAFERTVTRNLGYSHPKFAVVNVNPIEVARKAFGGKVRKPVYSKAQDSLSKRACK